MEPVIRKKDLVAAIVLSFVCFVAMGIVGSLIKTKLNIVDFRIFKVISLAFAAILTSIVIINFSFANPKTKTLDIEPKKNLNLSKEILKIKLKIAIYCLYIVLIFALSMAVFCLSFITDNYSYSLASIVAFYCLMTVFVKLFHKKNRPPTLPYFDKTEIPEISKIIEGLINKFNIKNKWKIVLSDHNEFGIFYNNKTLVFVIGIECACLLTKKELESILHHEIAHIKHKHLIFAHRVVKFINYFKLPFNANLNYTQLPFVLPSLILEKAFVKFSGITSTAIELCADKFAKQYVDKQEYINALAKLELLSLADNIPASKLLEGELPVNNFWQIKFSAFLEEIQQYHENYEYVLDHQIKLFEHSAPTFASRKTLMEVAKYDYFTTENDEDYIKEQQHIAKVLNQRCYNSALENYTESRQKFYLDKQKIIEQMQSSPLPKSHPEFVSKNLELANTFLDLDKEEQALSVLNFLIDECKSGKAALIKANILDSHCDMSCLDCLMFAIDEDMNSRYSSLNLLATLYAKYGQANKLASLNDFAQEKLKELKIFNRGPNYMENLCTNTLTKEVFDRNLDCIKSIWQNNAQKIYLVCQKVTPKHIFNCYIIQPKVDLTPQQVENLYRQTFDFLDNSFDDFYDKSVYNYYSLCTTQDVNEIQLANIQNVANSLIYEDINKTEKD